jgi:hypothetical protein
MILPVNGSTFPVLLCLMRLRELIFLILVAWKLILAAISQSTASPPQSTTYPSQSTTSPSQSGMSGSKHIGVGAIVGIAVSFHVANITLMQI